MMSLVEEHGVCVPCSVNFSTTLQTEILSTETSELLKQIISVKAFNSVFDVIFTLCAC